MTPPEVQAAGDGVLFTWHDYRRGIGFERLSERADGIHAEVSVVGTDQEALNGRAHIHWARLNLSSTTARDNLAKYLAKRTADADGAASAYDWAGMVEYACTVAARRFREGAPFVDLATLPEPPAQRYLVDKLLIEGRLSIIYSAGGSGKSLLGMALAIAVRTGLALPGGLKPLKQTGVLYLDYESDEEDQRTRLGYLARGLGLRDVPRVICRRQTRPLAADIARLRAEVDRLDIGFVVVDSLAYALDGSPLDADVVIEGCNALRSLRKGVTPLAIAHIPKGEKAEKAASVFGSVFQENAARSMWEMRSNEEPDGVSIALFHRKVNWGKKQAPIGLRVVFDEEAETVVLRALDVANDPELASHGNLAYRIIAELRRGKSTPSVLADNMGEKVDVVRVTLNRLVKGEKVVCLSSGGGRSIESVFGLAANGRGQKV